MSDRQTSSNDVSAMDDIAAIEQEIETLLAELAKEVCGDSEAGSPFLFAEDQTVWT